jgi:hypothetical protein
MKDRLPDIDRKKAELVTAGLLVLGCLAGAAYVYSQMEVIDQVDTFDTNATILDSNNNSGTLDVGIATGQGMSFGEFDARFNKTKTLNLSAGSPALVKVSAKGNISEYLKYKKTHLFENRTHINFEMIGNQSGFYDGEIRLDMVIAQNKWGEKWINLVYNYF